MTRVAVSKLYTRSLVEHLLFVWFSDDSCFCLSLGLLTGEPAVYSLPLPHGLESGAH